MKKQIRIGNAGGFWGDDLQALKRQLTGGQLDYISIDYLAEITMSILRKQQIKNPALGYVHDFVNQIIEVAPIIKEKHTRIIANAGGINPVECARKILKELEKVNIKLKIAIIEGDNIIDKIDDFYPAKSSFKNMENDTDFASVRSKLQSANAYLGVAPVVKALETGADIIICGRVTDTAITIAPMVYEFGWALNDWDKLASGLVAGHIIECGAQATGGNFTDWHLIKKWENFGYPVVEINADGTFAVTKHENTGGLVTVNTVKEQLVYEMGNPSAYISPDVVADFGTIQLAQDGENRVKVWGVKGMPSTPFLKVSMAYADGYKATGSIIICGEKAVEKAHIFATTFWKRLNINFEKTNTEMVGHNASHKTLAREVETNEILLRLSVYDSDAKKLDTFGKSIAPLILSGPQGVAVTGGRPSAQEVMTYYPTLIPKELVPTQVSLLDDAGKIILTFEVDSFTGFEQTIDLPEPTKQIATKPIKLDFEKKSTKKIKLRELCLARSGDKGDMANIGVVARSPEIYEHLKKHLTAGVVKTWFDGICKGNVKRYELDNLQALNFLLEESLDGGGTKSLMIDAQGKTYASALLGQEFWIEG